MICCKVMDVSKQCVYDIGCWPYIVQDDKYSWRRWRLFATKPDDRKIVGMKTDYNCNVFPELQKIYTKHNIFVTSSRVIFNLSAPQQEVLLVKHIDIEKENPSELLPWQEENPSELLPWQEENPFDRPKKEVVNVPTVKTIKYNDSTYEIAAIVPMANNTYRAIIYLDEHRLIQYEIECDEFGNKIENKC